MSRLRANSWLPERTSRTSAGAGFFLEVAGPSVSKDHKHTTVSILLRAASANAARSPADASGIDPADGCPVPMEHSSLGICRPHTRALLAAEHFLELTCLEHLGHDVRAPDELTLDVELWDRRPIGVELDRLSLLCVRQDVARGIRRTSKLKSVKVQTCACMFHRVV